MDLNNFDKDLLDTFYNDKNVEHVLYFGEIVEEY